MSAPRSLPWRLIGLVLALGTAWYSIARRAEHSLVIYCTHDLVYAEPVLEEFTRSTGIRVTLVGDTEATKSLGLTERLLREGDQTPCDLFWNNEVLGTIRLQQQGLLSSYRGTNTERIPVQFRDPNGQWYGFGGRLRVWICAADDSRRTPFDSLISEAPDLRRVAVAKPLFGTTFTQFAVLWKQQGATATQAFHQSLVTRECRIVAGNAMVRDMVAGGGCDYGMTDTDDVFAALDAGYNVTMEPIRIAGRTICIPNTVALLESTDRPEEARQLLEYLLSEEVELQLARTARQIPLGTVDRKKIPAEVQPLAEWARESWNVADAAAVAGDCLEWLKAEYTR